MSPKNRSSVICFALLLAMLSPFVDAAFAQEQDVDYGFLNPGIRIGYTFGGGLTVGFEISAGAYNGIFGGAAAGIDYTVWPGRGNLVRLYLEGEIGLILAGVGFGGALLVQDGETSFGRQTTVFGSWPTDWSDANRYEIIVPYYRVTRDKNVWHKELGFMYKYSYPIGKGNYDTRWDWGD